MSGPAEAAAACANTVTAQVVALDQDFFYNRYGAVNPSGMIFALRQDVVDRDGLSEAQGGTLSPGAVSLRSDKRPRPLTLRVNRGDCLRVEFENLLSPQRRGDDQPATRHASFNVVGLPPVDSIESDGSNVGENPSSLVAPGQATVYTLYAEHEGAFMAQSMGSVTGGEGNNAALAAGLFGAVNVQPPGAEWYRSQLTASELEMATVGTASTGHPLLDYDAVYPAGHRLEGRPILRMVQDGTIVHSDLNAVITGPNRGNFPAGTHYKAHTPTTGEGRSRDEPYREFTVIFHDEIVATQAFPGYYEDPVLSHTLHSVRDGFGINYGTGGIGSEILANRLGVGPVYDCVECKYEEFFLTSWAVGDPAMVVDKPANFGLEFAGPNSVVDPQALGPKATKAHYPADPSNVHHSYLGDHVRFRNIHVGPGEHHIFHLHAHQWVLNPNDDDSVYLDSQAVGPGSTYTYEIAFNGSGNRNQTAGDSIFHCHFYPHFAQGMWELWRVHDVFEAGTKLDASGRPLPGARALPDGEIAAGTPIPALVPIPTLAMAPLPAPVAIENGQVVHLAEEGNPGYPFFVPGQAGHRPPRPPLDMAEDGGLPRHIVLGGEAHSVQTRLDFSKEATALEAVRLPEDGTAVEQRAMQYHAVREHPSILPVLANGAEVGADFITNGQPPVAGAPFADPCFGAEHDPNNVREYKIAVMQLDITYNKVGWHDPQARIAALWGDVADLQAGRKAPEPLIFRANSHECIVAHHTNLVPKVYELNDYQVRTPTDIIGQHIHLVKFDVLASDGGGNGFNYEDGTMSPGEVVERIHAMNATGGIIDGDQRVALEAQPHSYFGVLGAQTSIQRWHVDPILSPEGEDATLRTVFSHDHFGPSTHQQTGLYTALAIQPMGSQWRDPETGTMMGSRFDGGPTSFRADILPPDSSESFREFVLMATDFAPAYKSGGGGTADAPRPDPQNAIIAPPIKEVGLPYLLDDPQICPGGAPLPCPEAISAEDPGVWLVNYRNEPLAHRTFDPFRNTQTRLQGGDLAYAYSSQVSRAMPELNRQPDVYPPLSADMRPGDPFTPLLRAYHGDKVQVRMIVGGQEEGHVATVNGVKWLFEPDDETSGWRNAQMMGISQHFEFEMPLLVGADATANTVDYLWRANSSSDGQWHGMWGLIRSYRAGRPDLLPLPNNAPSTAPYENLAEFDGVCPNTAPVRRFDITAISASMLPGDRLVYNARSGNVAGFPGPLHDPTAMVYVHSADLVGTGRRATLDDDAPLEPLVLRANAGDCIEVKLTNNLQSVRDQLGYNTLPHLIEKYNANQVATSQHVGLHPQLVAYDVSRDDGMNVGANPTIQTVAPGGTKTYRWYAGHLSIDNNRIVATPVEFGATNLMPADPIKQGSKGLIGALIVEPEGATWEEDDDTRTAATITKADGTEFREFVMVLQDEVNLQAGTTPVPPCCGGEGAEYEDAGAPAINYRSEPTWFRKGYGPNADPHFTNALDLSDTFSNDLVGEDPQTPVFTAKAGDQVRIRLVQPSATNRNGVIGIHGHSWCVQPYQEGVVPSQTIAEKGWELETGSIEGLGGGQHFDIVLDSAGGPFQVRGDYLIRDLASTIVDEGRWAILRVE